MLATSAPELPRGDEWTYEVKWDGYRVVAAKSASGVQLISRNQKNLTNDYARAWSTCRVTDFCSSATPV